LDGTYFHYRRKGTSARSQQLTHSDVWLEMIRYFAQKHRRLYERHVVEYVQAAQEARVNAKKRIFRLRQQLGGEEE
jgi:N-glycosylase/DNA lyase